MNLGRIQFLSLATKVVTTAFGIAQSILVVRLLSAAEFGLVGLVMSIGSVIGVSQHLGIVDGAIREIAVRKKKQDVGRVFWVSTLIRQCVTTALSLGLVLFAGLIATTIYDRPEIIPYIYIFAGILVLQGFQDVFGATLTGLKKFVPLYIIQIITAAINVAVFGVLTWQFQVAGFFWAMAVTTLIMTAMFAFSIRQSLRGHLSLPGKGDVKRYAKKLIHIGVFMYLARIFFVLWQRLPILLLGGVLTAEELGYINVSLTFGSKLTIVAMALSEVNLAWMSSLYATKKTEFVAQATRNIRRVFMLMALMAFTLLFFTPEILQYIIGPEYLPAQPLIIIVTCAFFLYALIDIGTSSVFVPANQAKLRMIDFAVMAAISGSIIVWLLYARPSALLAVLGMLAGAAIAYAVMLWMLHKRFAIKMLTWQMAVLLISFAGSATWLYQQPDLIWRSIIFLLLVTYTVYEAGKSNIIPPMATFMRSEKKDKPQTQEAPHGIRFICFAGAAFTQPSWTNRQHVMSRLSEQYPVLYVEPRIWIVKFVLINLFRPKQLFSFLKRVFWYEKKHDTLYIKSQWNLFPGSRESRIISFCNHMLNRWCVLSTGWYLGFAKQPRVVWIYDTEAAEYLSAFPDATVLYDCVDDHAAQAGVNRNSARVRDEERRIMSAADIVTVTSRKLKALKGKLHPNLHLVLNAGDVELYQSTMPAAAQKKAKAALGTISHPIIGCVGALDSYKVDFDLLYKAARQRPQWQFVCIGSPVVDKRKKMLKRLTSLPNVHVTGAVPKEAVPAYVEYFDVCMIPYKSSRYNASSFPLKFWEFMATGKPIVVSGLPELKQYKPLIHFVRSPKEFLRAVESALTDPASLQADRKRLARSHSWEKRVARLLALVKNEVYEA